MGGKTDMVNGQFKVASNWRIEDYMRMNRKNIRNLAASVTIPVALLLLLIASSVQAAPRGFLAASVPSASSLGLHLTTVRGRLFVVGVTVPYGILGLQAGDQIVAVNGNPVSTEAAFMNLLAMSNRAQAPSIAVTRNGRRQIVNVATPPGRAGGTRSSGFINPSQMVMTSQGLMHRDAAARLGLPSIPYTGTPEGPHLP